MTLAWNLNFSYLTVEVGLPNLDLVATEICMCGCTGFLQNLNKQNVLSIIQYSENIVYFFLTRAFKCLGSIEFSPFLIGYNSGPSF